MEGKGERQDGSVGCHQDCVLSYSARPPLSAQTSALQMPLSNSELHPGPKLKPEGRENYCIECCSMLLILM
jgi:hypothetical protein